MTKNADGFAGMIFDDFAQARLDARAELGAAFAVGRDAAFDVVEPFVREQVEFFANLLPVQSRPVAKINFAQAREKLFARGAPFFKNGASVCWTRFIGLA